MLEQCGEAAFALGDLAAIAVHHRQFERDKCGELPGFDQGEIDSSQEVERLRPSEFGLDDLGNSGVDTEAVDEGPPFYRPREPQKRARIAGRWP